jgi:DNA-binding transcriptional ArsR family regulator
MVNLQTVELDLIFSALSDSTRRAILRMIGEKTRTITELAAPFRISLAAVSKHVKVLERAKLLRRTREGRIHHCALDPKSLATAEEAIRFYRQFWTSRLDDLERYLENESRPKNPKPKK